MPALSNIVSSAAILASCFLPFGQSPWDGTWKLNKATVHIIPEPLVVEQSGTHYTLKQGASYRFDCDGRKYPQPGSTAVQCLARLHGFKLSLYQGERLVSTWELEVHPGGNTMTDTVTDFYPGVPPAIEHDEFQRSKLGASTTNRIAGAWTGTRAVLEGSDALELRIHDGSLYFRDARDGEASDARLDGSPALFIGRDAQSSVRWTNRLEGDRRIVGHAVRDGKELNTEVFELSADGKSIHASQPGSPNQFEATYEKQ
jgi:hypothetical protein